MKSKECAHLFDDHLREAPVRRHERVLPGDLQLVKEDADLLAKVFGVRDVRLFLLLEVPEHPFDAFDVGGREQEGLVVFADDAALERRVRLRLELENKVVVRRGSGGSASEG